MDSFFRALILPITIFVSVVFAGAFGYMFFNHINFLDALHLVVVTIATCGFRPTGLESSGGKIFDISFIIISFTVMISVISQAFSMVVQGEIKGIRSRDKIRKMLKKIKDHYIVCGFGRVGKQVATQLMASRIPIIVIDSNPELETKMQNLNIPYIVGTLSSDEVLKKANVEGAKGLVACADSDVENVFITLSARTINPSLQITARASDPANEDKLRRAGANYVVSPYLTTGQKISSMILNPSVADFLDRVLHDNSLEVWFQEVKVPKNSKIIGKTLEQINLRKKTGVIVLAIKHADSSFDLSPEATTKFRPEDVLICIGSSEQIQILKKLF